VPVALFLDSSIEAVVGILAILAAGGAYVPLDPGHPPARLALILAEAEAPVILARHELAGPLPGATPPVVVVEEALANPQNGQDLPGQVPLSRLGRGERGEGETAAYVLFTSGSTGTPKGVVVRHRALTNHMLWMQEAYPLAPGDRVLQKTPLGFDAS